MEGRMVRRHNLENYDEARQTFRWESVHSQFSWAGTGKVNIAYEAIDRNAGGPRKNKPALIFTNGKREETYSFDDLRRLSNRFANLLRGLGVERGERVCLYLPPCPEFYVSLLGAVKAGAVAVPVYSGLMGDAVRELLSDSEPAVLVTTGGLRQRVDTTGLPVREVICLGGPRRQEDRDWENSLESASEGSAVRWVSLTDPLQIIYTSGSTGRPKGVLHVHEAMLHLYQTGHWVLDLQEDDVYWCTADPGWITGISYGVWSPWLNGATNVVRAGRFSAEQWYATIEKYRVSVWYSTPTAFRKLMAQGSKQLNRFDLGSLRHILSVGEPLNPAVIRWGMQAFGLKIHDTWWMTETGGQMICNFPCLPVKLGSMGKPIPGVYAAVVDAEGRELPPLEMGNLALRAGWPGMLRGIWNDEEKFQEYFRLEPWYLTGDLAYQDEDGYFWFQGRADDVINTEGRLVSPFEVESRLAEHPAVAEAGVIGRPDPVKGESIKAYVVLRDGYAWSRQLETELKQFVRTRLAALATPEVIEVCQGLPKTRSGKVLHRVLKAWDLGLPTDEHLSAETEE